MNDDTERWLPVVDFAGVYEISSQGRIRGLDRVAKCVGHPLRSSVKIKGRLLNPSKISVGYYGVKLSHNQKQTTFLIHRLVCAAFHGPGPEGQEVRHLNGNPVDNRAENLAWGTRAENVQDMIRHGRHHMFGRTECKLGHPLVGENVYWVNDRRKGKAYRTCRICKTATQKRARAAYNERRRQLKAAS